MRNPNDVLNSLSSKATTENYYYERLYRNLFNPNFYLLAYQNISGNHGNMTPGIDKLTMDGMGMERISNIIEKMRNHSYQPNPVRRQYIPKKNGKLRPLGIPSTDDKLVQEVVRMILESIYEPTFSNQSHGFRPKRSCHSALTQIQKSYTGVKWFVEGDIKGCFDNIDQHILVDLLKRKIRDVEMIIRVLTDGSIRPKGMIWEDGKLYKIDKVKFVTPAAATRVGGRGIRYTVMIQGQERYFYDDEGHWFTEVPVYTEYEC